MKYSDELKHFGVPGMKWGIRRYVNGDKGSERYNKSQFMRDRSLYGNRAAKRIQKSVLRDGNQVSGARSSEAARFHRAERRASLGGKAGAVAGGIAGYAVARKATPAIQRIIAKHTGFAPDALTTSIGIGTVGGIIGRYAGTAAGMLSGGYSPRKYRG